MSTRWSGYVTQQMRGTQKELAERAGVNAATLNRWLNQGVTPSPEQVIAFARGLEISPIQALVMSGHLTPGEARMSAADLRIDDISDVVLLDELRKRAIRRSR